MKCLNMIKKEELAWKSSGEICYGRNPTNPWMKLQQYIHVSSAIGAIWQGRSTETSCKMEKESK